MSNIAVKTGGFQRGEVYYVRYDMGVGSEEAVGRPYVIISSDEESKTSPLLTVIPMTTSMRYIGVGVELTTTHRRSWALCQQISSLDKSRFGDRMCLLSAAEMAKIDAALVEILGLPVVNEKKQAEHDKQIAIMSQAIKDAEKAAADSLTEIEVLKRAYERVLDKLVEQRIERDIKARAPEPEIVETSEPVVIAVEPEPELVDINRCTIKELRALNFNENVALNIMANRPFMSVEDLRIIPGVTRVAFGLVEKKITVGDTAEFRPKKKEKPQGEWDRPITWATFKAYSHAKQVECLTHFKNTWGCGSGMMSEMFGLRSSTLSTYWKNNDLKGLLVHVPKETNVERFRKWLKDNAEV